MIFKFARTGFVIALLVLGGRIGLANAAELVYFHSKGCSYCELWDHQIAPIYPKTDESKVLPLRVVNSEAPLPSDISFIKGVVYTPTFVAVEHGKEVGRIVGYPGEDFFWVRLDELVKKVPVEGAVAKTSAGASCPGGKADSAHRKC